MVEPKQIKKITLLVGLAFVVTGLILFSLDPPLFGNLVILGIMAAIIPYVIVSYFQYKAMRAIEEQVPTFLLDVAEAQKTGMMLPEAVKTLSKADYGKLSPEIKKINDQLSWGIPIQEVMDRFAKRLSRSTMIGRTVRIITEAYNSGGDISRTMESTAQDLIAVREAERERKAITSQHVLVMYALYFIFIGIIVALSQTLVPILNLNVESSILGGGFGFQDPCLVCVGSGNPYCINCFILTNTCAAFSLGTGGRCYYNALFLLMTIIQGIFSGLVAGEIGENSIVAGLKHAVIMTTSGFGILMLLFILKVL